MYSEYLVNNRFYLKEKTNIECAEYFEYTGNWSGNHECVIIDDYIDIFSFVKNGFTFIHSGKHFIYWCDISIFLKLHCKAKSEIRNEYLDKILNR